MWTPHPSFDSSVAQGSDKLTISISSSLLIYRTPNYVANSTYSRTHVGWILPCLETNFYMDNAKRYLCGMLVKSVFSRNGYVFNSSRYSVPKLVYAVIPNGIFFSGKGMKSDFDANWSTLRTLHPPWNLTLCRVLCRLEGQRKRQN